MSWWRDQLFSRIEVAAFVFNAAGIAIVWTADGRPVWRLGVALIMLGDLFFIAGMADMVLRVGSLTFRLWPFQFGIPYRAILAMGWQTRPGCRTRRTMFLLVHGRPRWRMRLWPSESPYRDRWEAR